MIALKHISKTFQQNGKAFKALDNVSLEIAEGDIVGIIGSSGAGKSTLIRCINLLEKPDSGSIIVNTKELTLLPEKQLAEERKKIGMIFQHFNLLSSRTVFDNIAFPLELDHTPPARIKERVNELLKIVGLEHKANEYPKNLSGGQKQRVAIARALANDPYLLLCDEATSALDPATTQSILQLLRDINQRMKITILLITHEMEVVKTICNHVAIIDHGKLIAKGTLEELISGNGNPAIKEFINTQSLSIPQEIYTQIQAQQSLNSNPIIEIELNGEISFEELISAIIKSDIHYQLIKAS